MQRVSVDKGMREQKMKRRDDKKDLFRTGFREWRMTMGARSSIFSLAMGQRRGLLMKSQVNEKKDQY